MVQRVNSMELWYMNMHTDYTLITHIPMYL